MKGLISKCELDFISKGIENNIRGDGRTCQEFRNHYLELGLYPQSSGSCRIKLDGGTDVLVGIRAEVQEPASKYANEASSECGYVQASVEWYGLYCIIILYYMHYLNQLYLF